MSQQDHHSPNQGLFAGRRVTVVQPDTLSRDRLVGQLSVLRYQDAGVITSQQMALLQRLLPRTRLESLLGSIWFQRRLDAALAVSREELQQILRLAGSERCDWMQQLGTASIWRIVPCCGTGCSIPCTAGGFSVLNHFTAPGLTNWSSCR